MLRCAIRSGERSAERKVQNEKCEMKNEKWPNAFPGSTL
jgi:hypothetical protein